MSKGGADSGFVEDVVRALSEEMPEVLRWAGAIARQLRRYDVSIEGAKASGYSNTDALTLADLTVQELLVAALRDRHPLFRRCRLEAEEDTGDLGRFAAESPLTIALDPIDGTKQYRDRTGNGYGVILTLRDKQTVHYSLVHLPEDGPYGSWVEVTADRIVVGPDDPSVPARDALNALPPIDPAARPDSPKIYLIGFLGRDEERARAVDAIGLQGVPADRMPGSVYPLFASGQFGGSLIHSPNVYDFPVSLHIARRLGGDAVMVHTGRPVDFRDLWLDERSNMLRIRGVVACSHNRQTLQKLVALARDWNPDRYAAS